jgi:hypothetical protein
MGVALQISITSKDMEYLSRELKDMPKKIPVAMSAAINRTLTACRKIIVNGIATETGIKNKSRIVKRAVIKRASANNLAGRVDITGRALAAINFPSIITQKYGVAYRPGTNRQAIAFSHGFRGVGIVGKGEQTAGNGNAHLFIRIPNTTHYVRDPHYAPNDYRRMDKIRPIYGPRITTIYSRNPSIKRAAEDAANEILSERIRSQVDRFLDRKKAARPEKPFNADKYLAKYMAANGISDGAEGSD